MNRENDHTKGEVDQQGTLHHRCLAVLSGNASVDGASHRGSFIGHFLANTCGLRATRLVEVKWGVCSAGEERSSWGTSEWATTLCILLKGRMQISFPQEAHFLAHEGDYLLWSAGLPHHWKALEASCVLTVRWPFVPEADEEMAIIMLTARDEVTDKVSALTLGADDYVPKPFAFDELVARMRAVLRRHKAGGEPLVYADLELDQATREVRRAGHPIELTTQEYNVRRLSWVLCHDQGLRRVGPGDRDGPERSTQVPVDLLV